MDVLTAVLEDPATVMATDEDDDITYRNVYVCGMAAIDKIHVSFKDLREADIALALCFRRCYKSGLQVRFWRAIKDRYNSSGRVLTPEEREDILRRASQVYNGPMV